MISTYPERRLLLAVLALTLAIPAATSAQEDGADDQRTLHWNEFTVDARLDAEGHLHVRERQTMVLDGDWNGGERDFDLPTGQQLDLQGIVRIDPATGARTELVEEEDLENVDEYAWGDGDVVRWRSRLSSDPPFQNREIVYELTYTLWPVLLQSGDDTYEIRHDFAFARRPGVIENFTVHLALDSAWTAPTGSEIRESAAMIPPGRGYVVSLPLTYRGAASPEAAAPPAPAWARTGVALGALLIPLIAFLGLRRHERELDRAAPIVSAERMDDEWLRQHIFAYPPEVVGTAWDRAVGEAEVAALLARLVEEGKLISRVEPDEKDKPVLHLQRVAPLSDFPPHERELLEALFFDGADTTDTESVREHYKEKGFDPAATIRATLTDRLAALPGTGKVQRPWKSAAAVILVGALMVIFLPDRTGRAPVVGLGLAGAAMATLATLPFAVTLGRRVTHRTGPTIAILVALTIPALLLALLARGVFENGDDVVLYRPGPLLLVGLLVLFGGVARMAVALARSAETDERLVFRRRLVSAREFFERELERPEPRLQDAWFPYLLAFGLGTHIDKWFRSFGGDDEARSSSAGIIAAAAAAGQPGGGHGGGGWTGGGPQFGGGSFGGGGAGGAWGVAAAGMAAGVSTPGSSGGGGGGAAISGGGGGGGW